MNTYVTSHQHLSDRPESEVHMPKVFTEFFWIMSSLV